MSPAKGTSPKPTPANITALGALPEPTNDQLYELESVLRYESLLEIVWAAAGGEIDSIRPYKRRESEKRRRRSSSTINVVRVWKERSLRASEPSDYDALAMWVRPKLICNTS